MRRGRRWSSATLTRCSSWAGLIFCLFWAHCSAKFRCPKRWWPSAWRALATPTRAGAGTAPRPGRPAGTAGGSLARQQPALEPCGRGACVGRLGRNRMSAGLLHPLKPISIKERMSVAFVERGEIDVLDGAFVVVDATGIRTHIPVGRVACIMLEPGTRLSHRVAARARPVGVCGRTQRQPGDQRRRAQPAPDPGHRRGLHPGQPAHRAA